jgi:hypothetical protein
MDSQKVRKLSRFDGFVKSSAGKARKSRGVRRIWTYAATTKDAAQRSIRTFYEAVILLDKQAPCFL